MTLRSTSPRVDLGWFCVSVLACTKLSLSAQEIPSAEEKGQATRSTAVQTQPVGTITNFLFQIEGTPLLSRLQELTGIVFQDDIDPQPIQHSRGIEMRGIEILPQVDPPFSTDASVSGHAFVPQSFPISGNGTVFSSRPAKSPSSLELRLLLNLKGFSMKPSQLFLNTRDGYLLVSGTAQEAEQMRELIENPPTNAVAYLKSLPSVLNFNEQKSMRR